MGVSIGLYTHSDSSQLLPGSWSGPWWGKQGWIWTKHNHQSYSQCVKSLCHHYWKCKRCWTQVQTYQLLLLRNTSPQTYRYIMRVVQFNVLPNSIDLQVGILPVRECCSDSRCSCWSYHQTLYTTGWVYTASFAIHAYGSSCMHAWMSDSLHCRLCCKYTRSS